MPTRFVCPRCKRAQRKESACPQCGGPLQPIEIPHTALGLAMWALAGIGAVFIVLAFFGFGILVLVSVPVLVAALLVNVVEDRRLDEAARRAVGSSPTVPSR